MTHQSIAACAIAVRDIGNARLVALHADKRFAAVRR